MFSIFKKPVLTALAGLCFCITAPSYAGVVFGTDGDLGGGLRWDADFYELENDGYGSAYDNLERSLDGGLSYSLQGGSLESYRDLFTWDVLPTVEQFTLAVDLAFAAWESVDPISGLGTDIYFVDDTANTLAVGNGFASVNILGAEIDLLATDAGDAGLRATSYFWAASGLGSAELVTLTSGTDNYAGSSAIIGSDINMNNNDGASYTLDWFQRILTHEIGHSLGLGDLEDADLFGFIDDNFDPANPITTLTNSWADLVDPYNPADSAWLSQFGTLTTAHLATGGVDLLMESWGTGVGATNPLSGNPVPLTNDEYGTRQFLYPFITKPIPEPAPIGFMLFGIVLLVRLSRSRQRKCFKSIID